MHPAPTLIILTGRAASVTMMGAGTGAAVPVGRRRDTFVMARDIGAGFSRCTGVCVAVNIISYNTLSPEEPANWTIII